MRVMGDGREDEMAGRYRGGGGADHGSRVEDDGDDLHVSENRCIVESCLHFLLAYDLPPVRDSPHVSVVLLLCSRVAFKNNTPLLGGARLDAVVGRAERNVARVLQFHGLEEVKIRVA